MLLGRVKYHESYRTKLRLWVGNDPSAGGDALRHGGCWRTPYTLPKVRFDNGRELVVLPVLPLLHPCAGMWRSQNPPEVALLQRQG